MAYKNPKGYGMRSLPSKYSALQGMVVNGRKELFLQINPRQTQFIMLSIHVEGTTRLEQSTLTPTECPIKIK